MSGTHCPKKITLITFSQSLFLTLKYFLQNRLLSYASACSFNFLFSFIPVFTIIILVLVRILHASPEAVSSIFNSIPELANYFNPESAISKVQSFQTFSSFEFIAVIFTIWMARRFFASISDSMQNIFHEQTERKAFINQVFTFLVEIIIICMVSVLIALHISLKTITTWPIFTRIPQLSFIFEGILSSDLMKKLPNLLIFIGITIIYRLTAGTKPSHLLCGTAGFLCTFSFWIFRSIIPLFLNVSRYNLIYGVLSHVIITLMDIFFFFTFFLFFAQYIFTYQFFNELLLGELYLLPKDQKNLNPYSLKRMLFIRPDYLLATGVQNIRLKANEEIFHAGDSGTDAYYVSKGSIKLFSEEPEKYTVIGRGEFFGETACIIPQPRNFTAQAVTDSEVIKINSKTFSFLLHQNHTAAKKALGQISSYFD